jgi:hypothetical protein
MFDIQKPAISGNPLLLEVPDIAVLTMSSFSAV